MAARVGRAPRVLGARERSSLSAPRIARSVFTYFAREPRMCRSKNSRAPRTRLLFRSTEHVSESLRRPCRGSAASSRPRDSGVTRPATGTHATAKTSIRQSGTARGRLPDSRPCRRTCRGSRLSPRSPALHLAPRPSLAPSRAGLSNPPRACGARSRAMSHRSRSVATLPAALHDHPSRGGRFPSVARRSRAGLRAGTGSAPAPPAVRGSDSSGVASAAAARGRP